MNVEERELILGLFERIRAAPAGDNDPEAERLILDAVARNPNAPYILVQTVLLQEEALRRVEQRIRELESSGGIGGDRSQRSFLRPGPSSEQPIGSGSVPSVNPQRQEGQFGGPAAGGPQTRSQAYGGSFLGNALSTAGGVASGILLAEGIRGLFGSDQGGAKAASAENPTAALPAAEDKTAEAQPESAAPDQGTAEDAPQNAGFEPDQGWDDDGGDWGDGDIFDV